MSKRVLDDNSRPLAEESCEEKKSATTLLHPRIDPEEVEALKGMRLVLVA